MPAKSDVIEQIRLLLEEKQKHSEALASIIQTLDRIAAMVRGSNNGGLAQQEAQTAHAAAPRPPASSAVTLADYILRVMQTTGKPISISDLTAGVKAAGYKSRAKDFRPVINLALIKDKRFKRVGRGVYTMR